jgi:hypothetical protein
MHPQPQNHTTQHPAPLTADPHTTLPNLRTHLPCQPPINHLTNASKTPKFTASKHPKAIPLRTHAPLSTEPILERFRGTCSLNPWFMLHKNMSLLSQNSVDTFKTQWYCGFLSMRQRYKEQWDVWSNGLDDTWYSGSSSSSDGSGILCGAMIQVSNPTTDPLKHISLEPKTLCFMIRDSMGWWVVGYAIVHWFCDGIRQWYRDSWFSEAGSGGIGELENVGL